MHSSCNWITATTQSSLFSFSFFQHIVCRHHLSSLLCNVQRHPFSRPFIQDVVFSSLLHTDFWQSSQSGISLHRMQLCKKINTWKQAIRGYMQIALVDRQKNALALWNYIYTGTHVRTVSIGVRRAVTEGATNGGHLLGATVGEVETLGPEYGVTAFVGGGNSQCGNSPPTQSFVCICLLVSLTPLRRRLSDRIKRLVFL